MSGGSRGRPKWSGRVEALSDNLATHRALGVPGADDRSSPIGVVCDGGRGRALLSDTGGATAGGATAALVLATIGAGLAPDDAEIGRGALAGASRAIRAFRGRTPTSVEMRAPAIKQERRERMIRVGLLLRYGRLDDVSLRTRRDRELAGRHDGPQGRRGRDRCSIWRASSRGRSVLPRVAPGLSDPTSPARSRHRIGHMTRRCAAPSHRPIRVKAEGLAAERMLDDLHG